MSETSITELPGIGGKTADSLRDAGFKSVEDIAASTPEALSEVKGFGAARGQRLIDDAKEMVAEASNAEEESMEKSVETKTVAPPASQKTFPVRKVAWAAAAALVIGAIGIGITNNESLPDWVSLDALKGPLLPIQHTASETDRIAPATTQTAEARPTGTKPLAPETVVGPIKDDNAATPQSGAMAQMAADDAATKGAETRMDNTHLMSVERRFETMRERHRVFSEYTKSMRDQAKQRHQTWRAEREKEMTAMREYRNNQRQARKAWLDETRKQAREEMEAARAAQTARLRAWRHSAGLSDWSQGSGEAAASFGFSMNQRYLGYGAQHPAWGYAQYPYTYPQARQMTSDTENEVGS